MLNQGVTIQLVLISLALAFAINCPGPMPSPMVPPVACDNEAARQLHSSETCPNWSAVLDSPPAYCTDAGTVVDGYDWCDSEGSQ